MIIPTIYNSQDKGDLYSILFTKRMLFINEDITKELASIIVGELMYLDSLNHDDITIHICTNGGDLDAATMIIDAMSLVKSDICTINIGAAYSCGALLLIAGTSGKRYAFPNSRVLLHQPLIGLNGFMQTSDLEIKTNQLIKRKKQIKEFIFKHSFLPEDKIDKVIDRDTYFTAEESLVSGLIDKIL